MTHVFISYVRENQETVDKLYNYLIQEDIKVWVDREDISPGEFWKDAIRKAIDRGDFFIACFSKEYNDRDKTYMNEELSLAVDQLRKYPRNRSWFIPICLSGDIPDWSINDRETLQDIQKVDLNQENWDKSISRIVKVIKKMKLDDTSNGDKRDLVPEIMAGFSDNFNDPEISTLKWSDTPSTLRISNRLDQEFSFICPPGGSINSVYGTKIYTADSSICSAAVHCGLINARDGGVVTILIQGVQDSYEGTQHNGIKSRKYRQTNQSFTFVENTVAQENLAHTSRRGRKSSNHLFQLKS